MRLEMEGVSAGYHGSMAIRDVDLAVPSGTAVALLGPNGAGKTTLLSVASGLVRPQSGRVTFDGVDVTSLEPHERTAAGLCHITEGRSIFRNLTVEENLTMFLPKGARSDRLELAVASFPKLGQRRRQIAGSMSGGEQQMLALSRAYVCGAPIVLLDEVSMGLAPIIVDEIFEFLARVKAEGISLLIVEQYVRKALALADIVLLLVKGRIIFAGDVHEARNADLFDQYLGSAG